MHFLHQIKESQQDMTFLLSLWLQVSGIIIQPNVFISWDTLEKNALPPIGTQSPAASWSPGDSPAFNQLGMILLRLQHWQAVVHMLDPLAQKCWRKSLKIRLLGKFRSPALSTLKGSSDRSGIFTVVVDNLQCEREQTKLQTWWWGFKDILSLMANFSPRRWK